MVSFNHPGNNLEDPTNTDSLENTGDSVIKTIHPESKEQASAEYREELKTNIDVGCTDTAGVNNVPSNSNSDMAMMHLWKTLDLQLRVNIGTSVRCGICLSTMTNPLRTPCVHSFCKDCILASLLCNKYCPECKSPLSKRQLQPFEYLQDMAFAYKDLLKEFGFAPGKYNSEFTTLTQNVGPHDFDDEDDHNDNASQTRLDRLCVAMTWQQHALPYCQDVSRMQRRENDQVVAANTEDLGKVNFQVGLFKEGTDHPLSFPLSQDVQEQIREQLAADQELEMSPERLDSEQDLVDYKGTPQNDPDSIRNYKYSETNNSCKQHHEAMSTNSTTVKEKSAAGTRVTFGKLSSPQDLVVSRSKAPSCEAGPTHEGNVNCSHSQEAENDGDLFMSSSGVVDSKTQSDERKEENGVRSSSVTASSLSTQGNNTEYRTKDSISANTDGMSGCHLRPSPDHRLSAAFPNGGNVEDDGSTAHQDVVPIDPILTSKPNVVAETQALVDADVGGMKGNTDHCYTDRVLPEILLDSRCNAAGGQQDDEVNLDPPQEKVDGISAGPKSDAKQYSNADLEVQQMVDSSRHSGEESTMSARSLGHERVCGDVAHGNLTKIGISTVVRNEMEESAIPNETKISLGENSAATNLAVGTVVDVQARTWPGVNKPGGVGRITSTNKNGTFNIAYVLGGKESGVEAAFIRVAEGMASSQDEGLSTASRRRRRPVEELPRELLHQLAVEGFDTGVPLRSSVGRPKKKCKKIEGPLVDSTNNSAAQSKNTKIVREPKNATSNECNTATASREPSVRREEVTNTLHTADKFYEARFQQAADQGLITVAASGLNERDIDLLKVLCTRTFDGNIKIKTTEAITSKTTFCIISSHVGESDNIIANIRSFKAMMCALEGVPMVSPDWLSECAKNVKINFPLNFIRSLPTKSKKIEDSGEYLYGVARMAAKLQNGTANLPFRNHFAVFIGNYHPTTRTSLSRLFTAGGGRILSNTADASFKMNELLERSTTSKVVVLCSDSCVSIPKALRESLKVLDAKNSQIATVVSYEWIAESVTCAMALPETHFKPKSMK
ncbi:zinc finger C3HC4 type domain containing protein [Nitzschia inconspicua]|uniref:Zinc finger C3HC4 type domain containing protein n=1 Tax=Nitzschia inconspicua TaxID=303405 RepID=A0A9K3KYF1_9STRA|nr:zinc finger C3HC4 type domain containing protein [Nitzschia inconspicua]